MRFHFSCAGGGFTVDAGAIFSQRTITAALDAAVNHWIACPYCRFKKDLITPHDSRRDV